jgi:hypothetical protein
MTAVILLKAKTMTRGVTLHEIATTGGNGWDFIK